MHLGVHHAAAEDFNPASFLHIEQPLPPHLKQLTSISQLGSREREVVRAQADFGVLAVKPLCKCSRVPLRSAIVTPCQQPSPQSDGRGGSALRQLRLSGKRGRRNHSERGLVVLHKPDLLGEVCVLSTMLSSI
jgi:hypothetical protein